MATDLAQPVRAYAPARFVTRRIVHPVYLTGIVAVVYLKFWRMPMYRSDTWNAFADWVTRLYTSPMPTGG